MALACIYELRSYLTCFSDFQKISIFFYYSGIFPNSHYFYADALWGVSLLGQISSPIRFPEITVFICPSNDKSVVNGKNMFYIRTIIID